MSIKMKAAFAAVSVAALLAGCGGGSSAKSSSTTAPKASSTDSTSATDSTDSSTKTLPNVVGKTFEKAKSMLEDAGVQTVRSEEQASTKASGTVLEQVPGAGAPVSDTVTLKVAKKLDSMPDLKGKTVVEVRDFFSKLDVKVTVVEVLDDNSPDGQVVDQTPQAGAPVESEVVIKVSRKPVTAYLKDLQPVSGSFDTGTAEIAGTSYAKSVYATGCDSGPTVVYNLGKKWTTLRGTVGIEDSSRNQTGSIEIQLDGRSIYNKDLALGAPEDVKLDLTGVLRMTISFRGDCSTVVAFGDARLLGVPSKDDSTSSDSTSSDSTSTDSISTDSTSSDTTTG